MEMSRNKKKIQKGGLEQEVEALKNSLADCQRMLETATRDAAENDRRSGDLFSSSLV